VQERGLKVRDRIRYVVGSVLTLQLSDPSGTRGEVVGLFSQPLAQQVFSGDFGYGLAAPGVMLAVALLSFLAFCYSQRHPGGRNRPLAAPFWTAMTRPAGWDASAEAWLDAEGDARLRGPMGIPVLGASQIWHHFTAHPTAASGRA
jgi:hypothetical protein